MAICINCDNPAQPDADYCAPCEEKMFKKIGGWLYLPALGLLATLVINAWSAFYALKMLLDNYAWFSGEVRGVLITELLLFSGLFLLALYVSSLFIRKKRQLPRFYIGMLLYGLAVLCADLWLGYHYLDMPLSYENVAPLGRTLISLFIWIPYFIVSVRVKRTFVN
ncbi:DUF2569 domain-containing protein [Siccibacter colletis]|uniref:DUF2569 domain-containing protein n=1 Tax=Siccibacter colletis TaxID=1505757 RepID=UPI003CEA59B5